MKYLVIALFSLGLMCASCGQKKKAEAGEPIEQQDVATPKEGAHNHDSHEGHDH